MPTTRALASFALIAVVVLAACSSAAAPSPSTTPGTPAPTPTAVPGDPGAGGGSGGTDPGSGGTGGGIVIPVPGDPNSNPLFGKATYVTPAQGLLNLHSVNVQLVRAVVNDDGSTTVDLRWWSGVAPCSQLGAVQIARDDTAKTIRITVIEGSGGGQVACIDIAQLTATQVQLDALGSGSWTISAEGDAPAITLVVR
jgi:hypothetical protein